MKRSVVFMAVVGVIIFASLVKAEDYRVIRKISVPLDVKVYTVGLSPDGSKVVYIAINGEKWSLWINDRRVSPEEVDYSAPDLAFSPDGSKVAYWARRGKKYSVWINDRRVSPEFDLPGGLTFSPDGSKVAYWAERGEKYSVWIDDKKISRDFGYVKSIVFSPDGSKIAYSGRDGGRWSIWINEREMPHGFKSARNLMFSADGSKIAYFGEYVVKHEAISFVVVNDKKIKITLGIDDLDHTTISPDGMKVAYGRSVSSGVWINNRMVSPQFYDSVGDLTFSPDSSKVLYSVSTAYMRKSFVMINDKKISPEFDWIKKESLAFSPDGSEVAYVAVRGEKYSVWIDDRRVSPEFDNSHFATEHFNKTGKLIFAGYDKEKREIVHAVSLVTEPVKKVEAGEVSSKVEAPSEVSPSKGFLGVSIQDITPDLAKAFGVEAGRGVLVGDVIKGGSAETAGIKTGDIILEFDRKEIKEVKDLLKFVSETEPGKKVAVLVWRDGNKFYLAVTVGERPKE